MRKIWDFIKRLFTPSMARQALSIAKAIAAMTPTRGDDEIIALFERYAVPGLAIFIQLPPEQRGLALLEAAATELARYFPNAKRTELDAAVISAVGVVKGMVPEELVP